jgi:hypothetical protein
MTKISEFVDDLGPAIFKEIKKAGPYGEAIHIMIEKMNDDIWRDFLYQVADRLQEDGWEIRKGTFSPASTPTVSVDSDASPPAFPMAATNGMTLRDHFAGQALAGLMASSATDNDTFNGICDMAYKAADEMLARRGKG